MAGVRGSPGSLWIVYLDGSGDVAAEPRQQRNGVVGGDSDFSGEVVESSTLGQECG
jgi:hypothetical protein